MSVLLYDIPYKFYLYVLTESQTFLNIAKLIPVHFKIFVYNSKGIGYFLTCALEVSSGVLDSVEIINKMASIILMYT